MIPLVEKYKPTTIAGFAGYLSLPILKIYRNMCVEDGCTSYQVEAVDAMIIKFERFAVSNRGSMKQPGIN